MDSGNTARDTRVRSSLGWGWAVFILLAGGVMLPFLGLFTPVVIGVPLALGGGVMRRATTDPHDRARATGIMVAGLALAATGLALLLLLTPVSEGVAILGS